MTKSERVGFTGSFGAIAASVGSAVGLGNVWKFPYELGRNGGSGFLIVYIICILVIGLSFMLCELVIGRRSRRNPVGAFEKLAPESSWYLVGYIGVGAAFMILAFYSVIAGWTLDYIFMSATGKFSGLSANGIDAVYTDFVTGTWKPLIWQFLFLIITSAIVIAGVSKGIERYSKILMPLLLFILIVMCVRSVTLPGASEGLLFVFKPDFSKLTFVSVLNALGQSAFSLSLGMGCMITYGSYMRKKDNLFKTANIIIASDTLISLLAAVMIFPAVFAFGIEPGAGPGLVFKTLPAVFQNMPLGMFFSTLFFILLSIAALTSAISLLEIIIAWATEELKMSRRKAVLFFGTIIFVLGVFCSLSLGVMQDFKIFGLGVFDLFDFATTNILLPLGGLFILIFVGWRMKSKNVKDELSNGGTLKVYYFRLFEFVIKFIAPVAIAIVFMGLIGII